jgi:predicted PurR-regulated permease PerM
MVSVPQFGAADAAVKNNGDGEEKIAEPIVLKMPVGVRSVALSVIAVLGLIFLLRYAKDLFVPAVLAILIAYALDPLVTALTRIRIPRVFASIAVVFGLLLGTGYGLYALRYQAIAAIESLPKAAQALRQKIQKLQRVSDDSTGAITKIQQAAEELEKTAAEATGVSKTPRGVTRVQIEEPIFRANDYLWSGSLGLLGVLSQAVMVTFLVFFILASGDLFKRKLVRVIGTRLSEKRVTLESINEINGQIERFLLIQVLTSILVGVGTALALWAYGVKQPAAWGLAAGVFNSIPYFGAIIVTAGLALVAFLQFGSMSITVQIAGVALAITSLEGFLLTPALMGRAARINGVAMFLSLLFWSWLWGVIGMIVAVPLMMVLKTVCDRIENLQPVGELLGERETAARI